MIHEWFAKEAFVAKPDELDNYLDGLRKVTNMSVRGVSV
jgi:hypothetical protein